MHTELQNLRNLSEEKFTKNLKQLAVNERKIHKEIILYITEVSRRRLDLKKGYSNVFIFLVDHIGFSRGTAQRGIDASRLSTDVPNVIDHIEQGSISLSQVTLLQKSFREHQKVNSQESLSNEVKQNLIREIASKSTEESQVIISQRLDLKIRQTPKISHQKNESVRFEVALTKVQWQKLNRMRELLSNSVPRGTWDEVLECVSDKVIKQYDNPQTVKKPTHEIQRKEVGGKYKSRTHIPYSIQRQIFNRDQCCQYFDNDTGKKCESRWRLQIDHIKPIWAGGPNSIQNLRILCGSHNRYIYRTQTRVQTI